MVCGCVGVILLFFVRVCMRATRVIDIDIFVFHTCRFLSVKGTAVTVTLCMTPCCSRSGSDAFPSGVPLCDELCVEC